MSHLFATPGCTCSDRDMVRAAVEGRPRPLCKVHDVDAIAQRETDDRRGDDLARFAAAKAEFDTIRDRLAELEPGSECSCSNLRSTILGHLSGEPPAPCPLHQSTAGEPPNLALNDDASLAAVIGLPLHRSTYNPPLDPLDAA
jgi:hypothetical protein